MQILTYPNEVLSVKCEPVTNYKEAHKIAGDMHKLLVSTGNGIGLAAPQVGINKRIIVIDTRNMEGIGIVNYLFNPKIIKYQGKQIVIQEGCLSFPDKICKVLRYPTIKVQYKNFEGVKITEKFEGLNAIVIQHELDHIDGLTMVDREIK